MRNALIITVLAIVGRGLSSGRGNNRRGRHGLGAYQRLALPGKCTDVSRVERKRERGCDLKICRT
jgi:hypothetical protein